MIAVRHEPGNHHGNHNVGKTTVIVLCDDGSLRLFQASKKKNLTEFWMQPHLGPVQVFNGEFKIYKMFFCVLKKFLIFLIFDKQLSLNFLSWIFSTLLIQLWQGKYLLVEKQPKKMKTPQIESSKKQDKFSPTSRDCFEHCSLVNNNDLEFEGDLLDIYQREQLKRRLAGSQHGRRTNTQVKFKKPYTLTITLKNTNMVSWNVFEWFCKLVG